MPTGPQGPNGTYLTAPMLSPIRLHHKHMARLFAAGCTPTEVAEYTGFSVVQVTKIQAAPLFQKEVARLCALADQETASLREDLEQLAVKALCNMEEDLYIGEGKDPADMTTADRRMRQRASTDILDRYGLIPKQSLSVGELHLHKHDEKHIHAMNETELRNEVMELLKS